MSKQLFDDQNSEQNKYDKENKYSHSSSSGSVKGPSYSHTNIGSGYAVFRIGKKYKTMTEVKKFEKHMERKMDTPNADPEIKNEILIGTSNVTDDVNKYIEGIKLRTNSVIARDILLTASPNFFKHASEQDKRRWINVNVKWIKEKFGDNCTYATLHKDETTWHISALIVPKFHDEKRGNILANARYFDGIEALRKWQDDYGEVMNSNFNQLKRGIKFSKAKHIEIRQFYTMINKQIDLEDIKSITSQALNSELLQAKVIELQKTLNTYSNFNKNTLEENRKLHETVNGLKKDKNLYKDTIKTMSQIYDIPQNSVEKVLKYVSDKSKERVNELELTK